MPREKQSNPKHILASRESSHDLKKQAQTEGESKVKTKDKSKTKGKGKSKDKTESGEGKKREHRFRPGTVALREVRKEQNKSNTNIPKLGFQRLVREIAMDVNPNIRWTHHALANLHEATEAHLVRMLFLANLVAVSKGRKGVHAVDLQTIRLVQNPDDGIGEHKPGQPRYFVGKGEGVQFVNIKKADAIAKAEREAPEPVLVEIPQPASPVSIADEA